ncbi:TPA: ADP-ribosyl-(dinitrogen reductase) hydrolase [Pseudomonas aeruginosa]|uniref:ADP-ribosyl-(dinitrogen reductase) hydrolase n=1 Tax=Pseudomonas aeruginosa TaxID=287 RepID=UPI000BBD47F6|nr:ADP-ribosyl-(dinitrogen reductase) hydrolase [Pseudomonas aeruginosa]PCK52755.1 ADP-ribosyl-(dinitrogen reductase) hydrolase [Pseudomonas aeruginosa]HCG0920650.1 ADP-ribosyl-(dinitrogen reductase) hydrolase [Pseudomonas aeruginosa]
MENLIISDAIERKLQEKHGGVSRREIEQCFENCEGEHLIDLREDHKTDPVTKWFVAETIAGRALKICFVFENGKVFLKTAYEPSAEETRIYRKFAIK